MNYPNIEDSELALNLGSATLLSAPIARFSPALKQAMHAASQRGPIARGTWNGCAFNAASDGVVRGIKASAQMFGLPPRTVAFFIKTWDKVSSTDEEATAALREAIQRVGLFTEPNEKTIATLHIQHHKGEASDFDKFAELVSNNIDWDTEQDIAAAVDILSMPFNEQVASLL